MDQTLGLTNALIQIAAILSYQYLALVWPLYFIMLMLALLILMQTIAAGAVFARITMPQKDRKDTSGTLTLLVAVLYFMSAYHIHLIGYTVFATIAAAHIAIMMFSAFFMWIKK